MRRSFVGLVTGNGRIAAGGVDGTRLISGEDDAELEVNEDVELCVWSLEGGLTQRKEGEQRRPRRWRGQNKTSWKK